MLNRRHARAKRVALAAVVACLAGSSAYATEGYFQLGYGARQKALAGAGAADSRDATAASLNPAGLVHVPDQVDMSVSLFSPHRDVTGSGTMMVPQGEVESDRTLFLVPNLAWSKRVRNPLFDVVALTVYGNGGMNSTYTGGNCMGGMGPTGIFCGGKTGVDLQQMLISAAFAKQIAPNLSVGVAPIVARQQFKAYGLGGFGVGNEGYDESWGGGVRGGIEWAITPSVRLGFAGNSRIYMDEFNKYKNLFAEQGDFDIPASAQVGIAIDLRPNLTLMADYKFINYSGVKSISNSSTNTGAFGSDNGPGFGWHDVNVFKVALEWRATPSATWRLGYSYNDNPIESNDVMLNILAPGVVQHHFTAGAEFKLSDKLSLELAGVYVPESSVKGPEYVNGQATGGTIDISMHQYEVTAGIKYRLDVEPEPLK
jgi:long-chain fatty acid transport protein